MTDTTPVRAPMMLPWLAHKAGITEHRAQVLWAAALRHTSARGFKAQTSEYWKASMDRLLELIAAESLREDAASFGWRPWLRNLCRNWETPITLWDDLAQPYIRSWRAWSHDHQQIC